MLIGAASFALATQGEKAQASTEFPTQVVEPTMVSNSDELFAQTVQAYSSYWEIVNERTGASYKWDVSYETVNFVTSYSTNKSMTYGEEYEYDNLAKAGTHGGHSGATIKANAKSHIGASGSDLIAIYHYTFAYTSH